MMDFVAQTDRIHMLRVAACNLLETKRLLASFQHESIKLLCRDLERHGRELGEFVEHLENTRGTDALVEQKG
jgi:hypothetical protein